MSIELLQTIKQQLTQLNWQERGEIESFLREQRQQDQAVAESVTTSASPADKRQLRAAWLQAHRAEYAGQYVALDGDQLLGTGQTYPEAAQQAKAAGVADAYIDYVYPADFVGEVGEWR